jgi:SAM-dependent methyltransferase
MHCAAAAWEEGSFWARNRTRLIVWAVRNYFPDATSLLDVGCGTGAVLSALETASPQLELTGCEPYRPALEQARRRLPTIALHELDARQLSFDAGFDVVTALDVLEHIDDDTAALDAIHRAVRPGGGVVIAVPQHAWLWSAADDWSLHERRYDREDLHAKMSRAGLEIVRTTSFVSLLLPGMYLARALGRRRRSYDPLAEFRLPRLLDSLLGLSLRLELSAIERGVSFPAGGSLLVVARRREQTLA